MTRKWYFRKDGVEIGPVAEHVLTRLAERGGVSPETPLRADDDATWRPAGEIEGLFPENGPNAAVRPKGGEALCPRCWSLFRRTEVLSVARGPDLIGDPALGESERKRFLPTRFTPKGQAIDDSGAICPDVACPRCRGLLPSSLLDFPAKILSIVGAPYSGKSYFITTMARWARERLDHLFGLSFADADAEINSVLNANERLLFLNPRPNDIVAIEKTEEQGELYVQVRLDGALVNLPRPFVFLVRETARRDQAFNLVLYDNAGEQFQPGRDNVMSPGALHPPLADGLVFLFDPEADPRAPIARADAPERPVDARDQAALLTETISRIRRYRGLGTNARDPRPLIVVLSKYDLLAARSPHDLRDDPLWETAPSGGVRRFRYDVFLETSFNARETLLDICPEIVSMAEDFFERVYFMPVSALGAPPETAVRERDGVTETFVGARPANIHPLRVEAPLLGTLAAWGALPVAETTEDESVPPPDNATATPDFIAFQIPGTERHCRLPAFYAGATLRYWANGTRFRLPGEMASPHPKPRDAAPPDDDAFWKA